MSSAIQFGLWAPAKSMARRLVIFLLVLTAGLGVAVETPPVASAHGPVAPIASSYLARVGSVPRGLKAEIVDGDQRMWLRVPPGMSVIVLDYRGAPYLRFSPSGIAVNQNSETYYLNQTPVPYAVPGNLGPNTPPRWDRLSGGESYSWHDGRLHALASVAIAPGSAFVGRWRVPILLDGARAQIAGSLWHADGPSLVWFWPIVVLIACVLAGWRVRRERLDRLIARGLAVAALAAIAVAVVGRELHGRPAVSVFQLVELGVVLAFVLWALHRVVFVSHGYFTYLLIAVVALWQGIELIPTLLQGFVLAAEPAFLARLSAVVSVGCAVGLLLMVFRMADYADTGRPESREAELEAEDESEWELA